VNPPSLSFVVVTITRNSPLERFRSTGTVFIAWHPGEETYEGYWDSMPEGGPVLLEQMAETRSLNEAVEWGRQRTGRVLIRPQSDPGEYYWAGVGDPQDGDAGLKRLAL